MESSYFKNFGFTDSFFQGNSVGLSRLRQLVYIKPELRGGGKIPPPSPLCHDIMIAPCKVCMQRRCKLTCFIFANLFPQYLKQKLQKFKIKYLWKQKLFIIFWNNFRILNLQKMEMLNYLKYSRAAHWNVEGSQMSNFT